MSEPSDDAYEPLNRAHWDEVFEQAVDGPHFPVERFLAGRSTLPAVQTRELGDVSGLVGIHLQCGIGLDTLSLVRDGADMTGIDLSPKGCDRAREIAIAAGLQAEFLVGDVLRLPSSLFGRFDFVYTSNGVLRWLPDLKLWADSVRSLLRAGGWLYIYEVHPLVYRLSRAIPGNVVLSGDYFGQLPQEKTVTTTHLGQAQGLENRQVVHTDWTLDAVVRSLLSAGLRIEQFSEHANCPYSRKGMLAERGDGTWGLDRSPIPLAFSIRARAEGP
jgi:SAM-dependent methyltransferase